MAPRVTRGHSGAPIVGYFLLSKLSSKIEFYVIIGLADDRRGSRIPRGMFDW